MAIQAHLAVMPIDKRLLNAILAISILDFVLFVFLIIFAFIHRSDSAVHVLGPVHGIGFLIMLLLAARGANERQWGWWFPLIILVTAGPIGAVVGDVILRRRHAEQQLAPSTT